MATIRVFNRRLEQALFSLGVNFLECDKNDEGMTFWTYARDEKTEQIIKWFKEANENRRKAGW